MGEIRVGFRRHLRSDRMFPYLPRHGIRQRGLDAHLYDPHDQRHALPSYVHLLVVQHRVPKILCAGRQVANRRLFV